LFSGTALASLVAGTPAAWSAWTRLDLGVRALTCIASPGHDAAAVTFYDAYAGLLLIGDTVYPGRLYVEDWPVRRDH
jgi:glyoxylase-like metal-dependent hydrolase (beta-lactamase superfamily II)